MSHLPHLTVLLSILAEPQYKDGLTPDQMLKALADKGTTISRPTLNRVLVAGREEGKLVAEGLTTGRTYRLVDTAELVVSTPAAPQQSASSAVLMPERDIVSAYASRVWSTADVLRGVGIRQNEWPAHMMPFFALMLLESRVLRVRHQAIDDLFEGGKAFDRNNPDHLSDLKDYYIAHTPGTDNTWHEGLLLHGEGVRAIAQGGASGILGRLNSYLAGFDTETQRILGVNPKGGGDKGLRIAEVIDVLASKGSEHLAQWALHWAQVDLVAYDSSAITTLEEHVKRKWSEWDAATAGEHYTPYDMFGLIGAIEKDQMERHPFKSKVLRVYDPTCGGGNMLFGVADEIKRSAAAEGKHLQLKILGQEINDTLYALASVEARFREGADIRHGNTLTEDQFTGEEFDLIFANPPYGVDWKSIVKDIVRDATGRFLDGARPPTSDGQHLFLQHVHSHMSEDGRSYVFCSGSTLFSGNAGGGESNARLKYFQTDDNVMGIIQLPKEEFFNTGINTYLWVFNRNKPDSLKKRVFFLDASSFATKMRKSLGSKRNELSPEANDQVAALIREAEYQAEALMAPKRGIDGRREKNLGLALDANGKVKLVNTSEEPALLRLMDVDEICYNRLDVELTRGSPSFKGEVATKKATVTVLPRDGANADIMSRAQSSQGLVMDTEMDLDEAIEAVARFELAQGDIEDLDDRIQELQADPKTLVAAVKQRLSDDHAVVVKDGEGKGDTWVWNLAEQPQERTLWKLANDGSMSDMGRASLTVNARVRKARKDDGFQLVLEIRFSQDTERDTEITPYSSEESQNKAFTEAFLGRWVHDDYTILGQTVGCEVNFNRLFPATSQRKTLKDIQQAIAELDNQMVAVCGGDK